MVNVFPITDRNVCDTFRRELVGVTGVEPVTSSLSGTRSNQLSYTPDGSGDVPVAVLKCYGGGKGTRTPGIQLAKLALYQLSYAPLQLIVNCQL